MIVLVYAPNVGGRAAAQHAALEAARRGCPIVVVDGVRELDALYGEPLNRHEAGELAVHLGASVAWRHQPGAASVVDTVLTLADQSETELIVIGLMQRERFDKRMLTSTTRDILLGAPCPVITLAPAPGAADTLATDRVAIPA